MSNCLPVLSRFLPDLEAHGVDYAIATAILAYATGDAFGVAYEFEPRVKAPIDKSMLGKANWPTGGVSDDTLLSLMTISCLESATPSKGAENFLTRLFEAKERLRGLGPTTRHALGMPVEEREVGIIGITNGGMMRTALLGLGFSELQDKDRIQWVRALCSATHSQSNALFAALIMAEVFASATQIDCWDVDSASKVALQNVDDIPAEISEKILHASEFKIRENGVSLDPIDSLLAVMSIVRQSKTVWEAYENAICAGGDTDTVAALSGALIALRNPDSFYELDFIEHVNWTEIPDLAANMALLLRNRRGK